MSKDWESEAHRLEAELNEALGLMYPGGEITVTGAELGERNGHTWSEIVENACPTCGKDWWEIQNEREKGNGNDN